MKVIMTESLDTVERERERERERATLYSTWEVSNKLHTTSSINSISDLQSKLFLNKIGSINCAKKYKNINKDRLYAKVKNKNLLLQNSLSFLCVKEVIETKDKYA